MKRVSVSDQIHFKIQLKNSIPWKSKLIGKFSLLLKDHTFQLVMSFTNEPTTKGALVLK